LLTPPTQFPPGFQDSPPSTRKKGKEKEKKKKKKEKKEKKEKRI
jgi:hypothetical protein